MRVVSLLRLPIANLQAEFRLVRGPEDEDIFYECNEECCFGAGISPFKADVEDVPEEVIEQMRIHFALRHLAPVAAS